MSDADSFRTVHIDTKVENCRKMRLEPRKEQRGKNPVYKQASRCPLILIGRLIIVVFDSTSRTKLEEPIYASIRCYTRSEKRKHIKPDFHYVSCTLSLKKPFFLYSHW